ncbi:MAG: sugar phosphate isomerase/epimerase [Chitinophagaceae bacterium]
MITRKSFIKRSGLLTAGLAMKPSSLFAKDMKIGIQLYSIREIIGKDVDGFLAKISKAGYSDVETYGGQFFGLEPKAFKELLVKNHLTSLSGHYTIDKYLLNNGPDDDVKVQIDKAKAVGQEYLTVSSFSHANSKTTDDYKRVAERFNQAGKICKSSGIKLGYHNHNTEFDPLNGGVSGYDVLLKETDPALLHMELDLYWAVRGGQDPVEMFKKYPGRFEMWHVKDMDKSKTNRNTEIGNGSIDFKKIFANAKLSGMKRFYMEQENFDIDPIESITKSSNYIKQTLLKELA